MLKPMRNGLALLLTLSFILTVNAVQAEPLTMFVKHGKPNEVKFTSTAKIETIVGVTDKISGYIYFNPQNVSDSLSALMEVDMASLDTDNDKRNEHMRDNHLHTNKYPASVFTLNGLEGIKGNELVSGKEMKFTAKGKFLLHGIERDVKPMLTATYNAANQSLNVLATMTVKLSDYEIPRPQFLVLKLSDEQEIEIRFTATVKK